MLHHTFPSMLPNRKTIHNLGSHHLSPAVTQLLQAADNELSIKALARQYLTSIQQNRSSVRDIIIRSLMILSESQSAANFQNYRIKLSHILNFTTELFPSANLSQWLMNPGKNVSDEFLPQALHEPLRKDPKLRAQLIHFVGLTSTSIWKLGKIANNYYNNTNTSDQRTFIVFQESLENILEKHLFINPDRQGEDYFLIQATAALGGLHYTTIVTKWEKGNLRIGILDSLGFDITNQNPHFSNIYANTISQMATAYRRNVVIYATPTKRQNDIISCPQFILNDFFVFENDGFFNYVNTITSERADLVSRIPTSINAFSSTIIVPEHPAMLMPMQSKSVFALLKQNKLVEKFVKDPATFYKYMEARFWPLDGADGKLMNMQTQIDIFNLVPLLLSDIL